MPKILRCAVCLGLVALAGCQGPSPRSHIEHKPVAPLSATHSVAQTPPAVGWARPEIQRAKPSFASVVSRLQDLDYLPIAHAYIHGPDGRRIRHDAWLWPVPKALQRATDAYAWSPKNPFIRGAIVQFERVNGILGPHGMSEGRLHKAVLRALFAQTAKKDPWAYEWVYVTKSSGTKQPEQLHIWRHGKGWVWHTLVNTGVLGSTPDGTYLVYQRLPSTTMRGVFPEPISWGTYRALAGQQVPQWSGSSLMQSARGMVGGHPVRWVPYNDPGILWVNYFDDGRGIHYYPRAAYGFPQSAGCVEEPYKAAPVTYRLLHYGVPVTVSGARFSHRDLRTFVQ